MRPGKRHWLAAALVVVTSCTGPSETTTTAATSTSHTPATTTMPVDTTTVRPGEHAAYFFFAGYPVEPGPYLVPVARAGSGDVATALVSLLDGVTDAESGMGLSTPVPEGTRLLGVDIEGGIAAVDLSAEFDTGGGSLSVLGRVAQVVFTATQFDGVDSVVFLIEGTPVDVLTGEGLIVDIPQTRSDYEDLLPAILVDVPYWGSAVETPVTVGGLSDVPTVSYTIVDAAGDIVASGTVAVEDATQRSSFAFDVTGDVLPGLGSIILYEAAPDGTQRHVIEYPISFVP